ncbi:hypothetical protein PsorP6_006812 [Peronosclerospora sorghi]|uniref:Uncharacterized protein n=1 Tax=Peronosclerospora sorghi TaxID=230839 RepID=A0ACC0W9P7_9STRA|nr:hypothetical protein PsorP6_006812 [Peronosclerospora sorghi]
MGSVPSFCSLTRSTTVMTLSSLRALRTTCGRHHVATELKTWQQQDGNVPVPALPTSLYPVDGPTATPCARRDRLMTRQEMASTDPVTRSPSSRPSASNNSKKQVNVLLNLF